MVPGTSDGPGTGTGYCEATHTYPDSSVYTVGVTVEDDDTGTATGIFEFVVIFPNAGHVTGGGWINSMPGAYRADDTAYGRASFGFVSMLKKGASVPTGQTQFQLHFASFNFHSDVYDFLVVSGCKAQYRGTGTVNGESGYKFLLTAYDAQINGCGTSDRFRIKVWRDNAGAAVVYDNNSSASSDDIDLANPQVIASGSIVIHKAK
jgi:hypothetical protein